MPPIISHDQSARRTWIAVSIVAFGGSLAMAIDLAGLTPKLAQILGLL